MKTLMVDDKQACMDQFQKELSHTGYQIVLQTNPLFALNMLQLEAFDGY